MHFRYLTRLALCVLALALVSVPAAGAYETSDSPREVRAYWTEERMADAIPGDQLLAGVTPPVSGLGDLALGGTPDNARGGEVNATRVSNPTGVPFRTHGKVFFTLGGLNYVCSGTSVNARNRSLVATAGHCTYSRADGYASNFMFAPAYDNGPSQFGEWTSRRLKATPQWEANETIRYDAAFATMRKRGQNKLADVVGSRGVAFNQPRQQNFDVFGYPAESPFNGEQMWRCDSPSQGTDSGPAPAPTRISCNQTGGSSGGGWIIGGGKLNSVVSYGYECTIPIGPLCNNPEEGKLFGPYFGNDIRALYRSQRR